MGATYKRVVLSNRHWLPAAHRVSQSKIFKNSHRKKAANQVGYLGEIVFEEFLREKGVAFESQTELTTHDYLIENKLTLDVKTKDRTVKPQKHYGCSVPLYNHAHQLPDYYYFISLFRDKSFDPGSIERFSEAHIIGGIERKLFDTICKEWKAGQVDPANGTEFWTDCLNVYMEEVSGNIEMVKLFKGG